MIAARQQGHEYDNKMTEAIQRAYYQEARNPSENITLIELASEIGLEVSEFERDFALKNTQNILINEIKLARKIYVESFPSLVLKVDTEILSIPINYNNSEPMLKIIKYFK